MSKRAKAKKLSKEHLKCNKPRKTPSHKTKSHVVKACEDGKEKLIRFGQQGVKGAGKNPKTAKEKARKKSYYARHDAQDKIILELSAAHDMLAGCFEELAKYAGMIGDDLTQDLAVERGRVHKKNQWHLRATMTYMTSNKERTDVEEGKS